MNRPLMMNALLGILLVCGSARAMDRPKVALTVHYPPGTPQAVETLSKSLLDLLEVEVSTNPKVIVVERMQIDAALNELVLDRSIRADEATQLQLGKLSTADVLMTLEVLPPKTSEEKSHKVLVRVVKAQNAAILGGMIAPLQAERIDEAAIELAEYLINVLKAPEQAGITVAVGAFESQGRFDRLRPLELGIRDMMTTGLRKIGRFQVLQRSSMVELNRELDLIRSGLANQAEHPKNLPTRKAAFLLMGTLDERTRDNERLISVTSKLVHAATNKVELELGFESTPENLPDALARQVLLIGGHLAKSTRVAPSNLVRGKLDEAETLFENAVRDVRRFRRRCPIDFSFRHLDLSLENPGPQLPPVLKAESSLGVHLLQKSIDRLESVRFIYPERADAAYALGFCYSYHVPGIAHPERAAEMLETAYRQAPESRVGALALEVLAELNYHHHSGELIPALRDDTGERIAFAFKNMPSKHRTYLWTRLPELMSKLSPEGENRRWMTDVLTTAVMFAQISKPNLQRGLASSATQLANRMTAEGDEQAKAAARKRLETWANSDQPFFSVSASRWLGYRARGDKDFDAAVRWFLHAVEVCKQHPDVLTQTEHANLLMQAGKGLRMQGDYQKALELLNAAGEMESQTELNRGYVALETGQCLEALGKREAALEVYLKAAYHSEDTINNTDVGSRIQNLGGVPLDPDREIEVRYIPDPQKNPCLARVLATDGSRLFCAGGYQGLAKQGVLIYDIARGTWQHTGETLGRVTCLAYAEKQLWAGTDGGGLWRFDLPSQKWQQWTSKEGLPDDRIVSLATDGEAIYAGVGTQASGGLIRLKSGKMEVFDDANSPRTAPTHLVIQKDTVLISARQAIHERDRQTGAWTRIAHSAPRLFAGDGIVWASRMGAEFYPYDAGGEISKTYKAAWLPDGIQKAGYNVNFVIHQDGQIWFGGDPWQRFQSVGFYRLNEKTGEFTMFGPEDGFKLSTTYTTYDGVSAAGRLWIATAAGLAEVNPRKLETSLP